MSRRAWAWVAVVVLSVAGLVGLVFLPASPALFACGVVALVASGATALSQIRAGLRPESNAWTESRSEVDR